tara:strand:+ start:255 stop:1211 length:957 start_codon:yes stop_codon:yes gene_type:complete
MAFGSEQWMYKQADDSIAYLGDRAVVAGGVIVGSTVIDDIDYFSIGTLGNASDFGELQANTYQMAALSSGSRGVFIGGWVGAYNNRIDYITIATTSNATDFGDYGRGTTSLGACSDGDRGVAGGGGITGNSNVDIIEYLTIASTSNTTDFGNLTLGRSGVIALSNGTRGVFGGATSASLTGGDPTLDYVTIQTTSNATDFGDLSVTRRSLGGGMDNAVRGLWVGGYAPAIGATVNTIDYITIATTSNAVDFGDATTTCSGNFGTADGTRGVYGAGSGQSSNYSNHIEHVTIASTSNGADFGNLVSSAAARGPSSCSGD